MPFRLALFSIALLAITCSFAQQKFSGTPPVSGYEQNLVRELRNTLDSFRPSTDNLGNLYVTIGSGSPHRLIVTPMDEPGYIVSAITPEGYLRVQRLPQAPPNAVFDLLHAAQPVRITTRSGKKLPGVFAGLSVHLQPGRQNAPAMARPDEMYVDIGAATDAEARAAGVELLDPISLDYPECKLANDEYAGPGMGGDAGVMALTELLLHMGMSTEGPRGTLTVAFVAQQWTGARGLNRLLNEVQADEMIFVGRLQSTPVPGKLSHEIKKTPGNGVFLAIADETSAPTGLAAELKKLADERHIGLQLQTAEPPRIASYAKPSTFPSRFAQLGLPTRFAMTPAETISLADVTALEHLLYGYITGGGLEKGDVRHEPSSVCSDCGPPLLGTLTEVYGASGHEAAVREKILELLPPWAKNKIKTDAAGNLILHLGDSNSKIKSNKIAFVAHMDEIGYEVKSIEPDGRLAVAVLGGGYAEYFLGHPVLVHSRKSKIGGVLELPEGWEKPDFVWPHGPDAMDAPAHVYLGTHSAEETRKLGIATGDWVTIPKKYRPLLGTRANGRSFDDRVGCTALLEAVRMIGAPLAGRDVTFIWSTREEVGLEGAAAAAEQMAKENASPDFVFAIDTFVSSDSPLETKRFADAELGQGFVVRAVDNSNITPREYVDRVVRLAHANKIAVQFGVTGGGNDGSVFSRYGAVDVPLGWPLRYSHSPAEVIDTKDADALAKIIAAIAREW
jgi:putative aminopeptidase FrvX